MQNLVKISLVLTGLMSLGWSGPAQPVAAGGNTKLYDVRVEGSGKPMILIPGLTCGGSVWNGTVDHFKSKYQCHTFTLAGFAGAPPVDGAFVPTMREAVLEYIRTRHLSQPILVGHSLGGYLALSVAIAAPKEVGPVVVVDGAPATGVLMAPGASADQIVKQSAVMSSMMAAMSQDAFKMQNRMMLGQLVTDPKTAEWIAQTSGRSDVKTVARAMQEIMTADLRKDCARIESPVLLLGAGNMAKDDAAKADMKVRYEAQISQIPHHQLEMFYDSRHFIMLDQPQKFCDNVEQWLEKQSGVTGDQR